MSNISEQEWTDLKCTVHQTHDAVTRLETLFDGGPGQWSPCMEHGRIVRDHEHRMREIEGKLYRALGGIGLLTMIATVAAIYSAVNK